MTEPVLLIVEDEAILAIHLSEILTRQGYRVLKPVSTGEEAILIARQEQPTIILMDIELAGDLSGIETAERIALDSQAAVIFLTGFSQDAMLQKAKAAMPYGYLIKPVSERELIATIEMAIYKVELDHKIKQSEARYHTLVEQASDGILQTDAHGMLIEMNPAGQAMLGYDAEALKSIDFHRLLSFEQAGESTREEVMAALQQGQQIRCDCGLLMYSGAYLPVEISGKVLETGTFQAIFRDISERKAAEKEAYLNELRLRKLVEIVQYEAEDLQDLLDFTLNAAIELTESAIGYIYHYDEESRDFTLNSWSKAVMAECAVMKPQTCYHLADTGLWGEAVRQRQPIVDNAYQSPSHLKKGYPEGHVALHKYLTIPVFLDHQIVAVVGVANKQADYTETDILQLTLLMDSVWKIVKRREAEVALRNSATQHQALVQISLDGFLLLDIHGRILKCNQAYCQLSGYSESELMALYIHDLDMNESAEQVREHIDRLRDKGSDQFLTRHRTRHGGVVDIEVSVTYVPGTDVILSFYRDVSEREQSRKALEKKNTELQFLASAALQLSAFTQEDEVFGLIQQALPVISPNIFAVLMRTTADGKYLLVEDIQGIDLALIEKALKKIGSDLRAKRYRLIDSFKTILAQTRLYAYPDGFEGFTATEMPRPIAKLLVKMFAIEDVWVIGIADGGDIYGGLYLFTNSAQNALNTTLMESFFHQCYLALARIRAQAGLLISEERFRELSENIQETFWLRDYQTTQILYISPGFERMWGQPCQRLYEQPQILFDGIHPEDKARVQQASQRMFDEKKFYSEEFRLIKPDGTVTWIHARTYPVLNAEGKIHRVAGIADDITERKMAEQEHRALEDKFTKAFRTSPDSININRLEDGLYLDINEGFQNLTGFTVEDVIGKTSMDIDIWVNPQDRQELLRRLRSTGVCENLEADFRIKDGGIKTCLMSAAVIEVDGERCILSITRDISERKKMEEVLKEREKIFNHSIDMLCMAGFDGYFKVLNPAWEKTLGWSTQELLDQPWLTFVHPEDQEPTRQIKSSIVGGQEVYQFENRYVCKDGSIKWLSWNSFPYPEEGIMFGVARDVTDRKEIEETLRFSENRYRMLFSEMEEGFALHEIICDDAGKPIDYRFLEINPAFELQTGLSRESLIGRRVLEVLPGTEPYWIEAFGRVALEDETLHYENYSSELGRWFSVSAFSPRPGLFATTVTDITERKQADELLQKSAQDLNVAYDATLQGWSNALELREHETAGHSQRVVRQTLRLAQLLHVNPHEMIHIERGALLHDIGKMGIPDSILLKPGPLTDDEWQIMRQHPFYAKNLLCDIEYLQPALDIPYCHHEKWDGSGYPRKLKGTEIPLAARIFAIIDVWDALSSNRPYRPAWDREAIIQHLKDQSGRHFDPQVVEAFLSLLQEDSLFIGKN
jgi:PAS domain S-box-containing protein